METKPHRPILPPDDAGKNLTAARIAARVAEREGRTQWYRNRSNTAFLGLVGLSTEHRSHLQMVLVREQPPHIPDKRTLYFTPKEWIAFAMGAKAGEFNDPGEPQTSPTPQEEEIYQAVMTEDQTFRWTPSPPAWTPL